MEFEFPKHKKIIASCLGIMMKVVDCGPIQCSQVTLNKNQLIMKRQGIVVDYLAQDFLV
jgi:hypothetical protein